MKKLSLSVLMLIFLFALPASSDEIVVTGFASSSFFGGQKFISGGLCRGGSINTPSMDIDKVVWDDGRWNVTVELRASCDVGLPVGARTIDVIAMVGGQLSTPYVYHTPWTMNTTASGFYTCYDCGTETMFFFSGPATFNLMLISGSRVDFEMSFTANAPEPIPEPATFVLITTGLVGILLSATSRLIG